LIFKIKKLESLWQAPRKNVNFYKLGGVCFGIQNSNKVSSLTFSRKYIGF